MSFDSSTLPVTLTPDVDPKYPDAWLTPRATMGNTAYEQTTERLRIDRCWSASRGTALHWLRPELRLPEVFIHRPMQLAEAHAVIRLFALILTSFANCGNGLFATILQVVWLKDGYCLSIVESANDFFSALFLSSEISHSEIYESLARKLHENHPGLENLPAGFYVIHFDRDHSNLVEIPSVSFYFFFFSCLSVPWILHRRSQNGLSACFVPSTQDNVCLVRTCSAASAPFIS